MASSAAQCIGHTLQNARYHLKTSLCETDYYWQHLSNTPIYGTGQGSGTYSDLLDVHSTMNYPSHYFSPQGTNTVAIHNIGFVDDTTTTASDFCLSGALPLPILLSHSN